jgi:hypothetical protein
MILTIFSQIITLSSGGKYVIGRKFEIMATDLDQKGLKKPIQIQIQ